jgi:phosphoribosylformylglycinamidine cyclo-ligase
LLGEALLRPTTIYVKLVKALLGKSRLHGLAHITGGGITGNVPRILPEHCRAVIDRKSWEFPSVFKVIQQAGNIDQEEMFKVFNMGVGLIVVAPSDEAAKILETIQGQGMAGWVMGDIGPSSSSDAKLTYST